MFTMFCCTADLFGENRRVRVRVVVRIMVDDCYNMHMYKCTCNIINTVCIMSCMYTIPHMYSYSLLYIPYILY